MSQPPPALGMPSRHDVYLQPHSDDVCFSIGHLARTRGAGTLVTVFPVSSYRADQPAREASRTASTTLARLAEDRRFADACGMGCELLDHDDAVVRGHRPFDAGPAEAVSRAIEDALMRVLAGPTVGRMAEPRPWLFCPAGIGGHVDHLAVLFAVARHRATLAAYYRVAFYEDLHYASDGAKRERGIEGLKQVAQAAPLERFAWELPGPAAQSDKMALVRLYASQLTPRLQSIAAFTPAVPGGAPAHEALWLRQGDLHQLPG
jgi:LmbE family N-acetylglucosaminyl deacetylase